MTLLLENKVGIITAAGSGIGRASALACAREGAKVVVSDMVQDAGERTVQKIHDEGGEAIFVKCNVTDEAEVKSMVNQTLEVYGQLDFAHNNAGIGAAYVPVAEVMVEDWRKVLMVSLEGMYLCMKYQIPAMLDSQGGAIVNTSSSSGLVGTPLQSAYSAAKFGVNGLTKTAALEYGKQGIRVNSICPGMTLTPSVEQWMKDSPEEAEELKNSVPMGKLGTPEDQGNAVVWLCSDKAAYVTGVTLSVDGGLLAQ